jgi:hypothetical protein
VFHGNILHNIGRIFAPVGRCLQQFYNFLSPNQLDGVPLGSEEFCDLVTLDMIRVVLQPIDLDAEIDHWLVAMQCVESLRQEITRIMNLLGEKSYRMGIGFSW